MQPTCSFHFGFQISRVWFIHFWSTEVWQADQHYSPNCPRGAPALVQWSLRMRWRSRFTLLSFLAISTSRLDSREMSQMRNSFSSQYFSASKQKIETYTDMLLTSTKSWCSIQTVVIDIRYGTPQVTTLLVSCIKNKNTAFGSKGWVKILAVRREERSILGTVSRFHWQQSAPGSKIHLKLRFPIHYAHYTPPSIIISLMKMSAAEMRLAWDKWVLSPLERSLLLVILKTEKRTAARSPLCWLSVW